MMFKFKKLFIFILLGGILFFGSLGLAQENIQNTNLNLRKESGQEKIVSYKTEIKINKNSSIDVKEEIVYDFGDRKRHGIFRKIPIKYKTAGGNNRSIKISKIKILRDGHLDDVSITHERKSVVIKIGKAAKLLEGEHKYVIKYKIKGAINYFKDHSEFYWNVIGDQWTIPIENPLVIIQAPEIIKTKCFQGVYGSKEECIIKDDKQNDNKVFSFRNLKPGEMATVVVGIKPGVIIQPNWLQKIGWFLLDNWIVFTPFLFFGWAFSQWWKYGRDPKGRGTIIPYYDVPNNLSVAEVSAVTYNQLRKKDISAMIIQLAVKGYLKIKQEKAGKIFKHTKYTFYRTKEERRDKKTLTAEEKKLLDGLFSYGNDGVVNTDDLKEKFYSKISDLQNVVLNDIKTKGYLPMKSNGRGVALIIMGVVQMIILGGLSVYLGAVAIIAGATSFMILVFFTVIMGHRTKKGAEMKEKLLGLKMYLETAEKDRIKFHNAPDKNPKRFEKLLPYAMVFGVEKEWAEQFKDIYKQEPNWYQGGDGQVFSSMVLANSLDDFSKTANASMISSPSTASSGGSGFSGGGSGGGFGGGGGGSW